MTRTVSLGGTISLPGYQNIKLEISGPCDTGKDWNDHKEMLRRCLRELGRSDVQTRQAVERWYQSVIGGDL
jgi:hypothetical protein